MDALGRRSRHSKMRWVAVSIALGVAAFWVTAQAYDLSASWTDRDFDEGITILPWIAWLALYALGGFLATLALRPPRSLRYRPVRPLIASVVPILLIAHPMAWVAGWIQPLFLPAPYSFYASSNVQVALAVFVGLALATGFENVEIRPSPRPVGSS
jgi:hypothetical protein